MSFTAGSLHPARKAALQKIFFGGMKVHTAEIVDEIPQLFEIFI
jgi:hypothetical protein